ncbi:MAG: hypothetical protein JSR77_04530 [Planctomycetes bacterium]|nr:hypothetical protein [Planctomycetota bacterium]
MSPLAFILIGLLASATVTLVAWRGDRRRDLRRCAKCAYDLTAVAGRVCPECGHAAAAESELFRSRRHHRSFLAGLVATIGLAFAAMFNLSQGSWAQRVPRPVMAVLLNFFGAPPASGGTLPAPDPKLKSSSKSWDRLVWAHQAAVGLDAWAKAVLASRGPISDAELAQLVPLADAAHALFAQVGGTFSIEAWPVDRVPDGVARVRAGAANDSELSARLNWVLAELQFDGADYTHRPDFAFVPDEIIQQALGHQDAAVRKFGIDRFGRRLQLALVTRKLPLPPGLSQVEAIAATDSDAAARRRAQDVLAYLDSFFPNARQHGPSPSR